MTDFFASGPVNPAGVRRFEHGSRVPGWNEPADLTKDPAAVPDPAQTPVPEDLRTAIVLREIDGLSYEEIAQVMDCPIGTVRSRIFRARDAISAKLRPLLDAAPDKRW